MQVKRNASDIHSQNPATLALELHLLLAEIQKIDQLLEDSQLRATQLDKLLPQLGSEAVLEPMCRTQRRLGDIDFELIGRDRE